MQRHLDQCHPTFVVFYDVDLCCLRQLEMYSAINRENTLRVYILMYGKSIEEQRHLATVVSEQRAFETLIREQSTLLIPKEYDISRESFSECESTRVGGGSTVNLSPRVVVDVREFCSQLPSVLHGHGLDLVPVTLEVGDYVLTPDLCIERKSLEDLAQSLEQGRVFAQAERMLSRYKRAVLLVEMSTTSAGGPFRGQSNRRCRQVRSHLTVLARHQPRLCICWSADPVVTTQLFQRLKFGHEEPDVDKAMAIKSDELLMQLPDDSDRFQTEMATLNNNNNNNNNNSSQKRQNPQIRRMLMHLTDLTVNNVESLLKSGTVSNLLQLMTSENYQLSPLVGGDARASKMLSFLRRDFRTQ